MRLVLSCFVMIIVACSSCSNSPEKMGNTSADSLSAGIPKEDHIKMINENNVRLTNYISSDSVFFLGQQQIRLCEEFVNKFPTDPYAARYLDYAAKAAKAAHLYEKAVSLYTQIIQKHSQYINMPEVMFNKAFILDEDLNRDEEAKIIYTQLIQKYPDHQLAKNASALLQILYLSDEEIIEKFEKK